MPQTPARVESIVNACCVLHNLMRIRYPTHQNQLLDREDPNTHQVTPGAWREDEDLTALEALHGNTSTKAAKTQRNYLRQYYNSPVGSVPWQNDMI